MDCHFNKVSKYWKWFIGGGAFLLALALDWKLTLVEFSVVYAAIVYGDLTVMASFIPKHRRKASKKLKEALNAVKEVEKEIIDDK